MQYVAPGRDSNECSGGNPKNEYLTIKKCSKTATVNLKGYKVKDATGNTFTFENSHTLQPGEPAAGACPAHSGNPRSTMCGAKFMMKPVGRLGSVALNGDDPHVTFRIPRPSQNSCTPRGASGAR
ncbi:hypothetical protein STENM223S_03170 [Streptomyces tendae]